MKWPKDRSDLAWGPFLIRHNSNGELYSVSIGVNLDDESLTPGLVWVWTTGYCTTFSDAHKKAERWMQKTMKDMKGVKI